MEDSLHIHRLILKSEGGSAVVDRLRVERLLGAADLRPPGLPPSAVLIVRQMHDPLPGKLAKSRKTSWVDREWERRARGQLAEFYRLAARPARGPVSDEAQAVLFLDESELLACLALDVRFGRVRECWWWRSVLRTSAQRGISGQEVGVLLAEQMVCQPQAAAAAIAWLADQALAEEALLALTSPQAGRVLQAIAGAYRLSFAHYFPSLPAGLPVSHAVVPPPWKAPPAPQEFSREHVALLGLSIDLMKRPAAVHTQEYQSQASAWWQAVVASERVPRWKVENQSRMERISSLTDHQEEGTYKEVYTETQTLAPDPKLPPANEANMHQSHVEDTSYRRTVSEDYDYTQDAKSDVKPLFAAVQPAQGEALHHPTQSVSDEGSYPPTMDTQSIRDVEQKEGRVPTLRQPSPAQTQATAYSTEQPERAVEEILHAGQSTGLGGVLYLINMMAVLDLPGCYEDGWHLASRVGAWGTLDTLARELLGDELPGLRDDPLWPALARLDGRQPGNPPGCRLPRARPRRLPEFELPPMWLKGLPDLDLVPLSRARQRSIRLTYRPLLAGWLVRVLPFLDARLRLALRLDSAASLPHALLIVPGVFYLTPSNLDLVVSVESISLAARMAGLDSDPGWVPEFGRFIRFHFK